MDNEKSTVFNECWSCQHKRPVHGTAHIMCNKPDKEMTGDPHGIKMGWFRYPLVFDPTWKTKLCNNREANENE